MAKSSSPFSFLWQALLLPSKNPKLLFNIFLIYILSHALLYIGFQLSIAPLLSKFTELGKLLPTIDSSSPEFTEFLNTINAVTKELVIIEIVYYVFLFVTSCFLSIITYYASSTAYLGDMLTLKELLNKVKSIIKGQVITHLFTSLFAFIYLIIFAAIILIILFVSLIYNIDITSSWFLVIPLTVLATLPMIYLSVIWSMGVAISVIEPNFYGISVISCAAKLLKGKKMQVFLFILVSIIASGIIYVCNTILVMFASGSKAGSLVVGFVYQLLLQVVSLYSMMAITVLYYECNQSNGVEYTKVATTNIV